MESLKSLYFKLNKINNIGNLGLSQLPLVEDINFSENSIESITVLKFPKLKFLRLNKNRIKNIAGFATS